MSNDALPEAFDLKAYDLDTVRDGVSSIVDVRSAISTMFRWVLGVAVLAAVVAVLLFGGRLGSGAWTFIVAIGSALASVPIGITVGGARLVRNRLDAVTAASDRVVKVVGLMHGDLERVRDGSADVSMQKVAIGLMEQAIIPTVFGTAAAGAETLMGPAGFVARRAARPAERLVQRAAVAAIESLPDRQVGDLVDDVAGLVDGVAGQSAGLASTVAGHYDQVSGRIAGIVSRVARTSSIMAIAGTVAAFVPLAIWWLLTWLVG